MTVHTHFEHANLVTRVRDELARRAGPWDTEHPAGPGWDAESLVIQAVHADSAQLADNEVLAQMTRTVDDELCGVGPLSALLALPGVTDVLVNSPQQVWIDRGSGLELTAVRFPDEVAVRRLAQRLASTAGRRLDDAQPYVDACLPDGTRLHAVLAPVSEHTVLSLRVLTRRKWQLHEIVPPPLRQLLESIVNAKLAFLISGGTGSGKTTLLAAMLGVAGAAGERILLVEDVAEIRVDAAHVVRLVCRVPNVEGSGAVSLRELVRQSLRMRPDRIVVGEFRGPEIAELLLALNTGHEGGGATVHANSAADVPARLLALGSLAGLSDLAVVGQAASAVDVVVHLGRDRHSRYVETIGLLDRAGDQLCVTPVWHNGEIDQENWLRLQQLCARRTRGPL